MRKIRYILHALLYLGLGILMVLTYLYIWSLVPNRIYLESNQDSAINLHLPLQGDLHRISVSEGEILEAGAVNVPNRKVDFMKEEHFLLQEGEVYEADLKLLGFLPYKTVEIVGRKSSVLYPMGDAVGLYVKMDGIMVVDVGEFITDENFSVAPCKYILEPGDYIIEVNGQPVSKKGEFVRIVEESSGKALELTIRRDGKELISVVQPQMTGDNEYKLGIWVRDSLQGIGTIAVMDDLGNFVALGHSINDCDTGMPAEIECGNIYKASIVSVRDGARGVPGELSGVIEYREENLLGDIKTNTSHGVSGTLTDLTSLGELKKPMPIAYKQDILKGKAYIYSDLEEEGKKYEIEIIALHMNTEDHKKGIEFQVVDKELLDYSGGIVQGMSGSPIIQDGKIIGAVTHVLVNDPTRGYGIFIENMLEH